MVSVFRLLDDEWRKHFGEGLFWFSCFWNVQSALFPSLVYFNLFSVSMMGESCKQHILSHSWSGGRWVAL